MVPTKEIVSLAYIIHPGETETSREIGGKAAALAALHTVSLPIPSWFVVSPVAFTESLLDAQRYALEDACDRSDSATVEAILATVQPNTRGMAELAEALAQLCPNGEHVAVRSSALDEDGMQHSFAGQLDTFLFVSPEQVADRVVAVW